MVHTREFFFSNRGQIFTSMYDVPKQKSRIIYELCIFKYGMWFSFVGSTRTILSALYTAAVVAFYVLRMYVESPTER